MTAAIVAAGIGAVGAGMAASQGASAAGNASNAQTQTTLMGMAQQNQQFQNVQSLLSPYVQAATGTFDAASYLRANPDVAADPYYSAHPEEHWRLHGQAEGRQGAGYLTQGSLGAQQDLVGLNGAPAQQAAVDQIQNSPLFGSLVQQGENAMRQNAAATGGLRGGNFQGALAQFRPSMLSAAIADQYSRLGGLTTLGQNAAAGVGNAGGAMANANTSLLGSLGQVQAGNALAQGRAAQQTIGGITQGLGTAFGALGKAPNLFGSAPAPGYSGTFQPAPMGETYGF